MSNFQRFRSIPVARLRLAVAIAAALSAHAQAQDSARADDAPEEVFVTGRGETRQVQSITARQIEQLPAGTSPLKAIENFPGVNFQAADPYGAYEWSTRITVRGFNQNRMGFTLDGVPLGDMTYGNHNGLHISRAIPTELVDRVVLAQGTGALDTASASNLGGTIEFFSADPETEFGVDAAQTFGSDSARRTFVRLDSGEFGNGTRGYLTIIDAATEKWKGGGDQEVQMFNVQARSPDRGRRAHRVLQLFRSNGDRLSGPVVRHHPPSRQSLGQLVPGLERGRYRCTSVQRERAERRDRV